MIDTYTVFILHCGQLIFRQWGDEVMIAIATKISMCHVIVTWQFPVSIRLTLSFLAVTNLNVQCHNIVLQSSSISNPQSYCLWKTNYVVTCLHCNIICIHLLIVIMQFTWRYTTELFNVAHFSACNCNTKKLCYNICNTTAWFGEIMIIIMIIVIDQH